MKSTFASPSFLWQSCAEPSAAWFLVWMPLALMALDSGATLSSAMVRLLAVLMVAGLIWARGLGPGGALADRLFVAAWAGSWAAALGTLVTAGSWSTSTAGSAALFATLFVGAGWLGWAFHERQELQASNARVTPFDPSHKAPVTLSAILAAWLLASTAASILIWSEKAHWSDGIVLFFSLACFTAFQTGSAVREEEPAN